MAGIVVADKNQEIKIRCFPTELRGFTMFISSTYKSKPFPLDGQVTLTTRL